MMLYEGFEGQKNIIIGASGLIGKALYDNFIQHNEPVIGTYSTHHENNNLIKFDLLSSNFDWLKKIIKEHDNVYIMAANSDPSWIFSNPSEAKKLNIDATKTFVDGLKEKNPRIIFMSSVEVFDGKTGNYKELDKANPLNLYGRMKLNIEEYLRNNYSKSTIVRTGWNIGLDTRSRCVVRLTYDSLLRENAKMAIDNFFSISDVEDTANTLRLLGQKSEIKEIHICSDEVIRRDELADLIIENSIYKNNMNYLKCNFSEIKYSESRGRVNNLSNQLSKDLLNVTYKNTTEIITNKIKFIDRML